MSRAAALAGLALLGAGPPQAGTIGATGASVDEPMRRPAGDRLVWADEFDRPGLPDPAKWRYDASRNRQGWYNGERSIMRPRARRTPALRAARC